MAESRSLMSGKHIPVIRSSSKLALICVVMPDNISLGSNYICFMLYNPYGFI